MKPERRRMSLLATDPHLSESALQMEVLQELGEVENQYTAYGEKYFDVYPYEEGSVWEAIELIKELYREGEHRRQVGALLFGMIRALVRERKLEGAMNFVYEELGQLIKDLTSGDIDDFDKYDRGHRGDAGLALLGRRIGSMGMIAESRPRLDRTVYRNGVETDLTPEECPDGVILFICGYGASRRPYKEIFNKMNRPVVVYELPYGVVSDDPEEVAAAFEGVRAGILADPLLGKVTHVIGNSVGTMIASRIAVDICKSEEERKIKLALVQTGTGWEGALENTHARFARELHQKIKDRNLTFADFKKAVEKFNPGDLVEVFAELAENNQLDLSLFVGLGDRVISPAEKQVSPLLTKLDSDARISRKYKAYLSDVAGHQEGMLFFLWSAFQNSTEWSEIFNGVDTEMPVSEAAARYQRRGPRRENPAAVAAA